MHIALTACFPFLSVRRCVLKLTTISPLLPEAQTAEWDRGVPAGVDVLVHVCVKDLPFSAKAAPPMADEADWDRGPPAGVDVPLHVRVIDRESSATAAHHGWLLHGHVEKHWWPKWLRNNYLQGKVRTRKSANIVLYHFCQLGSCCDCLYCGMNVWVELRFSPLVQSSAWLRKMRTLVRAHTLV